MDKTQEPELQQQQLKQPENQSQQTFEDLQRQKLARLCRQGGKLPN